MAMYVSQDVQAAAASATFTYTILNIRNVPCAAGNVLANMMGIMATRWAGKLILTMDGRVLFDIATDRQCGREYPNAREKREELLLAESRLMEAAG